MLYVSIIHEIFHCMGIIHSVYSSVHGDMFPPFDYLEWCCCEPLCTVSVWTSISGFFGYRPRSWIAGLHRNSMVSFLEELLDSFPQKQHFTFLPAANEGPSFSTFSSMLVIFCPFYDAIPVDVNQYFTIVLIFIFLITGDVQYLFLHLWTICICTLEKCLLKPLVHVWIVLSFCFWAVRSLCIIWTLTRYMMFRYISFSLYVIFFIFLILCCTQVFNFNETQFIYVFFCTECFEDYV